MQACGINRKEFGEKKIIFSLERWESILKSYSVVITTYEIVSIHELQDSEGA
jgi:hypothetical protein